MYAMQGTMSVGAFMRSLGSAKAPWLTVDAAAESRDTQSIAYLYECLEKLAEEINEGRIKRKHIKDVLKDECGVVFGD